MRTVRIPLSSRKYPGLFALVDEADADLVCQYRWHPHVGGRTFYALHTSKQDEQGRQVQLSMHRFILGYGKGDPPVDHVNGDGLDNRRSNLRECNDSLNQANRHRLSHDKTSVYRGVTWHKQVGKWQAAIKVRQKNYHLGLYESEEEAAVAYDKAALQYFGDFARLNFGHKDAA